MFNGGFIICMSSCSDIYSVLMGSGIPFTVTISFSHSYVFVFILPPYYNLPMSHNIGPSSCCHNDSWQTNHCQGKVRW